SDPETRGRVAELEQGNRTLRQRGDAARGRVHALLWRLTFLEEQARQAGGNGGVGGAAGAAGATAAGGTGGATSSGSGGGGGTGGATGGGRWAPRSTRSR